MRLPWMEYLFGTFFKNNGIIVQIINIIVGSGGLVLALVLLKK